MSRAKCMLLLAFAFTTATVQAQPKGLRPDPFGPPIPGGGGIMGGDPRFGGPLSGGPRFQPPNVGGQPVQLPPELTRPPIDFDRLNLTPYMVERHVTPPAKPAEWPSWAGWPAGVIAFVVSLLAGLLSELWRPS
jgi:hypothetical protein